MNDSERTRNFWIGNVVLAVALLILLKIGALWEMMGVWAMILWAILAGIGAYFLLIDKKGPPSDPQ